jgi:tRNA G18 (ribose-2'-O)-methylase SpoU
MGGTSLFDERPKTPYALVVGSEASGPSAHTESLAHKTVAIPMQGGIESLNAAVAMATAMFVLKNNEGR